MYLVTSCSPSLPIAPASSSSRNSVCGACSCHADRKSATTPKVPRSSFVVTFSRKLTSRARCTADPRASALFFVSGSDSPYLNHHRAEQLRNVRTWVGESTLPNSALGAASTGVNRDGGG